MGGSPATGTVNIAFAVFDPKGAIFFSTVAPTRDRARRLFLDNVMLWPGWPHEGWGFYHDAKGFEIRQLIIKTEGENCTCSKCLTP